MKCLLTGLIAVFIAVGTVSAQDTARQCPTGFVCFTQTQANEIFQKLNELVAAKDLIIKLQTQAGTADTALVNALKVVEGWKELDAVNQQIIVKKDQVIALYERVMQIQMTVIENLEKRIARPTSTWDKIGSVLKTIVMLAAGVALGRGF